MNIIQLLFTTEPISTQVNTPFLHIFPLGLIITPLNSFAYFSCMSPSLSLDTPIILLYVYEFFSVIQFLLFTSSYSQFPILFEQELKALRPCLIVHLSSLWIIRVLYFLNYLLSHKFKCGIKIFVDIQWLKFSISLGSYWRTGSCKLRVKQETGWHRFKNKRVAKVLCHFTEFLLWNSKSSLMLP